MSKKEYDLTPLEVAKLIEENFDPWALAVARTCIEQVLGGATPEKAYAVKEPLKFLQLQNLFAKNLMAARRNVPSE